MSWWDDKAGRLQRGVRSDEAKQRDVMDYDSQHVRQSIVHVREDVVLLVAHVGAVNSQLRTIKWLLLILAVLVGYAVLFR